MACGLAEEETRLVAKRPGEFPWKTHTLPIPNSSGGASLYSISSLWLTPKTRIRYRPQTACGRYRPWEPTALRVPGGHRGHPCLSGVKAKPVPHQKSRENRRETEYTGTKLRSGGVRSDCTPRGK